MASEQDRPMGAAARETPAETLVSKEEPVATYKDEPVGASREIPVSTYKDEPAAAEAHVPGTTKKEAVGTGAGHKPTLMEQMKEKVVEVKDKLTGHEHHTSPFDAPKHAEHDTDATTTKAQSPTGTSPKGESFLQKIKDKLPGAHTSKTTTTTTPVHTSTETVPVHTTKTTTPGSATSVSSTGQNAPHEGIGEKISHFFKGGHSDTKTVEHKKEVPHQQQHEREARGVTESDALKD